MRHSSSILKSPLPPEDATFLVSMTVLVDLVTVVSRTATSAKREARGSCSRRCSRTRAPTHRSWTRSTLQSHETYQGRGSGGTHQLLVHPLGALGQELEVGVGVDVEDVDQLRLEQRPDVHPLLVHLLDSEAAKHG